MTKKIKCEPPTFLANTKGSKVQLSIFHRGKQSTFELTVEETDSLVSQLESSKRWAFFNRTKKES